MSKMKYVKDFDFGEKACNYQCGGPVMAMAKGGGVKEAKTGEMYSSRKAMAKHERTESPRMQKEEIMQSRTEKNIGPRGGQGMIPPAQKGLGITAPRRQMPVAPREPMIAPYKKGGEVMPKAGYGKVEKVISEYKSGKLHSGSKTGPQVTKPKQAVAIAMSEARRADKKNYAMGGPIKSAKNPTSSEGKMMGRQAENYSSVTGAGAGSKPIDMYEMAMYKKGGMASKKKC